MRGRRVLAIDHQGQIIPVPRESAVAILFSLARSGSPSRLSPSSTLSDVSPPSPGLPSHILTLGFSFAFKRESPHKGLLIVSGLGVQ